MPQSPYSTRSPASSCSPLTSSLRLRSSVPSCNHLTGSLCLQIPPSPILMRFVTTLCLSLWAHTQFTAHTILHKQSHKRPPPTIHTTLICTLLPYILTTLVPTKTTLSQKPLSHHTLHTITTIGSHLDPHDHPYACMHTLPTHPPNPHVHTPKPPPRIQTQYHRSSQSISLNTTTMLPLPHSATHSQILPTP